MTKIEYVRVGDVLRLERRRVEIDPLTEYSLIGVYSFGKGIFHRELQAGADLGDYKFHSIRAGDLVLSNIQAWEGAIAIATDVDEGSIATHRFLTYVPRDDRVDTAYLRYFFLSERGMELIRKASPGSVLRNRTLGIAAFESLEIPLPPLDGQLAMVRRLYAVNQRMLDIEKLSEHAGARMLAVAASLATGSALTDDQRRRRGWSLTPLRAVLSEHRSPVVVDTGGTYPNIGILSFGRGVFEKRSIDGAATSARILYQVRAGQFIYSRLFAFEGAYAEVPTRFDGYFVSNEFPVFDVAPTRTSARFLAEALRMPPTWKQISHGSKGLGDRRQRVQAEQLLKYEIWLPPLDAQRRVLDVLDRVDQASDLTLTARSYGAAIGPALSAIAFG